MAALLLLLNRAVKRTPATGDLRVDADRLAERLTGAYLYGRAAAAYTGAERFQAELAAMVPGTPVGALAGRLESLEEARRAHRAARGYTQTWLGKATDFAADGVTDPGAAAHAAAKRRLAIGADVEAADAFYVARREAIDEALTLNPELDQQLEQVWNVDFCERTCDVCESLDGTTSPLGEPFPYGDPRLHPNCHCEIDIRPKE